MTSRGGARRDRVRGQMHKNWSALTGGAAQVPGRHGEPQPVATRQLARELALECGASGPGDGGLRACGDV